MSQGYEHLFFGGQDDIRHNCVVIGHIRDTPVFYHFRTETNALGKNVTTVNAYRNSAQNDSHLFHFFYNLISGLPRSQLDQCRRSPRLGIK